MRQNLPYIPQILLPSEPSADTEVIWEGLGICFKVDKFVLDRVEDERRRHLVDGIRIGILCNGIRIGFLVTEENGRHRVERTLAECCDGVGENARISLRNARRDAVEAFKKAQKEGMPEDEAKDGETRAQKLLEKYSKQIDDLMAAKEKEIMTV